MYQYDVFISYKRGGSREEWMKDLFMPWFREQLDEAFANYGLQSPAIFFDQVEIDAGSNWQIAIRQAIARSKFMVSICTPTYFARSEWCMREFVAMYHRGKTLGFLSAANNEGLVYPVMKQKIENLPPFVQVIQFLDYSKFNQVGPAFKLTKEYLEFQGKVEADTKKIAKFIKEKTPPWRAEFESDEWLEQPIDKLLEALNIKEPKQKKPGWE